MDNKESEKMKMILFHGTTAVNAKKILTEGFKNHSFNWRVTSKEGYIYLSTAYASFYAMMAYKRGYKLALIKVEVDEIDLFPDDDFIMLMLGKPKYTQTELDRIDLEDYKYLSLESLEYMGNVCAKFEDIKIIGVREFNSKNLIYKCDPSITPLNYLIMGGYYRALTIWIYEGNPIDTFIHELLNNQNIIKK